MRYLYIALIVVLSAIVFTFMFQNNEKVTVLFLSSSITLPLSILVAMVYFLGMFTGAFIINLVRTWVQGATKSPGPERT